ncbi:hypothetical protein C8Q76DRAFT_178926 [Earliella scabrosa]|nr:hypothetical protein C8Q76DRAFT_178926 [Earliella scabrosa]
MSAMPVTSQPFSVHAPVLAQYSDEKGCTHQHQHQQLDYPHQESGRCHCNRRTSTRTRRIATAILLAFFSLLLLLVVSCLWDAAYNEGSWLNSLGLTENGTGAAWAAMSGFVKRQSGEAPASGGDDNVFIDRKCELSHTPSTLIALTWIIDYLIIIFVGLFLVVVAGICLSAWCCRGKSTAWSTLCS